MFLHPGGQGTVGVAGFLATHLVVARAGHQLVGGLG